MEGKYLSDKQIEEAYHEWVITYLSFSESFGSGTFEVEFKYAEDKVDNFLITDEGKVAFEHWYPEVVWRPLEKRILKELKIRKRKAKSNGRKPKSSEGFKRTA